MSFSSMSRRGAGLFVLALAASASQTALAAVLEGRVTDGSGEVGLGGALVTVEETGQTASTDRSGAYRVANLPAGDYTLTVSYLGADELRQTVSVPSDDAVVRQNLVLGDEIRVLENVLVTGQTGAYFSSINRERAADALIEVLSADAVGSLPDQNVAESARRIAGISVQNDQGEGRFVTIRGLDPALNSVSVNGVSLPAPEGDTRAVALDVIDSDALSSIVVSKSYTPDQDGEGIGGNINIETLSAFNRDGPVLRLKAAGIYSEITEAWGEKIGLVASDTFMDGRLGIAGNITYNRRDFGSDNTEVDGVYERVDDMFAYPGEELELRDYLVERERTSATLNFDYRLTPSTELYLRTLYNDFSDQEFRSRVEIKPEDAEFLGVDSTSGRDIAQFAEGDEIEYDRDIKDRLETQQIWSIQTGGETFVNDLTWTYGLSFTHSEEEEPDRLDTGFRADDVGDAASDPLLGLDITDLLRPTPVNLDDETFAYFNTASNFEFDDAEFLNGVTEDDEFAGFLDLRRDTELFGRPGFVKAGVKVRLREKSRDVDVEVLDGFDGDDVLLSQFETTVDYPLTTFGPAPNPGQVRSFFFQNRSSFEINDLDTAFASNGEDYDAEEDIYAGYLMAQTDMNPVWRLTGGVRVEATEFSATSTGASFEAGLFSDATLVDGQPVGLFGAPAVLDISDENDNGVFDEGDEYELVSLGEVRTDEDYVDVLPSINSRYELSDNLVFRGAYYRNLARPTFGGIVPTFLPEVDEGDIEGEGGNPDLDRQVADNFDISLEWYPDQNAVLSAGLFHKSIEDYIVDVVLNDVTLRGTAFDQFATKANLADTVQLTGLELSYSNAFKSLPAPWDGFLIAASYTYIDGEAEYLGRDIPLPRLSENVGSLIVGYDKYGLDLRAALSYRSEYLDELNAGGDGVDRYIDEHLQIDLEAQYDLTDQIELQLELQNANDEPFEAYYLDGGQRLLSQYEEYGYTARVGLRYRY